MDIELPYIPIASSRSVYKHDKNFGGYRTKRGDVYLLCPFHKEKTPSCVVFAKTPWKFHCFGCGKDRHLRILKRKLRYDLYQFDRNKIPQNMVFDVDKGELPF